MEKFVRRPGQSKAKKPRSSFSRGSRDSGRSNSRNGGRPRFGSSRDSGRSKDRDSRTNSRDSGRSRFGGSRDSGRDGRRSSRPQERTKVVCSACQVQCEVPFKPTSDKPIFCSDCFRKQSGPSSSARGVDLSEVNRKLDKILKLLEK